MPPPPGSAKRREKRSSSSFALSRARRAFSSALRASCELRLLPFGELGRAFRHAVLMQPLLHFHLILERRGLALHQRLLLGELLPVALGVVELELRLERVAGGLDRAARIQRASTSSFCTGCPSAI